MNGSSLGGRAQESRGNPRPVCREWMWIPGLVFQSETVSSDFIIPKASVSWFVTRQWQSSSGRITVWDGFPVSLHIPHHLARLSTLATPPSLPLLVQLYLSWPLLSIMCTQGLGTCWSLFPPHPCPPFSWFFSEAPIIFVIQEMDQ